jgi:hypothetical protein
MTSSGQNRILPFQVFGGFYSIQIPGGVKPKAKGERFGDFKTWASHEAAGWRPRGASLEVALNRLKQKTSSARKVENDLFVKPSRQAFAPAD